MDGSQPLPRPGASQATRMALAVDRDAIGLMKHASQLSHLVEWWLQGSAATMEPLPALRLGRKLERFRIAARLAEGKSSRQVQSTLDGLRQELQANDAPAEILSELDGAYREGERLAAASRPPPTVFQEAFTPEPETSGPVIRRRRRFVRWWLVVTIVSTAVAIAAAIAVYRPDLVTAALELARIR